jgi:hypothetical protein
MQMLDEAYSNFVNSINSDQTRQAYEYSLTQFLKHCQMDLDSFLRLSQQEISNIIINYLVEKKISRQYKVVIFSAIKHACEMNDVILNWKKLKKFIKSEKTDNSINGKDRGYTDKEILKILIQNLPGPITNNHYPSKWNWNKPRDTGHKNQMNAVKEN